MFKIQAFKFISSFALHVLVAISIVFSAWTTLALAAPAPPPAFSKASPASGATDQPTDATLIWEESSGADGYEYCIDTVENKICDTAWLDVGSETSADLALLPTTSYYWQVQAKNEGGTTPANDGSWWDFGTSAVPGNFGKISPVSNATNQPIDVTLNWEKSEDAISYEYCIDTIDNSFCDESWVDVGDTGSANPADLTAGTAYYWQVRASNGISRTEADSGGWWRFFTANPPGDFNKSNPADSSIDVSVNTDISWEKSAGANSYEYCFDVSNNDECNAPWTNVGLTGTASLSGMLLPGTTYYWQARSVNEAGTTEANLGNWWVFTTSNVPNDFAKNVPADGNINVPPNTFLDWGVSFGTDSYELCIDTVDNDSCDDAWNNVGLESAAGPMELGLATTYYWQVRAVHQGEMTEADSGAWWSLTTQAEPGSFSKSDPAHLGVDVPLHAQLEWDESIGAEDYEYCIDTVPGNVCDTDWVSSPGNLTDPLSLDLNTTYYWQVRALNGSGTTDANNGGWWTFTTVGEQVFADGFEDPEA